MLRGFESTNSSSAILAITGYLKMKKWAALTLPFLSFGRLSCNLLLFQSVFSYLTIMVIWYLILNICTVEIYLQGMKVYFYVLMEKFGLIEKTCILMRLSNRVLKIRLSSFNYTTCTYPVYCNRSFKH